MSLRPANVAARSESQPPATPPGRGLLQPLEVPCTDAQMCVELAFRTIGIARVMRSLNGATGALLGYLRLPSLKQRKPLLKWFAVQFATTGRAPKLLSVEPKQRLRDALAAARAAERELQRLRHARRMSPRSARRQSQK